MSMQMEKTYELANQVLNDRLKISEFAILIGRSYKQASRIINKIKSEGITALIHKNTNRIPHNKIDFHTEKKIIDLLKNKYFNFNIIHAKEMLEENEKVIVGKNILYRIAKKNSLIKYPRRRPRKSYPLRARFPREGMLVQFDGSQGLWFGNFDSTLIAAIDDATSEVVGAEFFQAETSINSLKVLHDISISKGIPDAYYFDQAGCYGKKDFPQETHIQEALENVGCKLLLASKPQSKGRIERLNRTLKDRLQAELRFKNINTYKEANDFLKNDFLIRFNKKFSIPPREPISNYRKLSQYENPKLIFAKRFPRKINGGNMLSFDGNKLIIDESVDFTGQQIEVVQCIDGKVLYTIMGKEVRIIPWERKRKFHNSCYHSVVTNHFNPI